MLKLEAGKKYVDRRGRVFGPVYCYGSYFCENKDMPMWYENGRIGSFAKPNSDMDLVAEYVEPESYPAEPASSPADDEYPQYWTALEPCHAYVLLERNGDHYCIEKDGTKTGPHVWAYVPHENRRRITKEEAEAMLTAYKSANPIPAEPIPVEPIPADQNQQPSPIESPEGWVEIDKEKFPELVPRPSDVLLFKDEETQKHAKGCSPIGVNNLSPISHPTWKNYKFVCRRKDLPSSPADETNVKENLAPTNRELFEMIANLRDQMDGISNRLRTIEHSHVVLRNAFLTSN